MAKELIGGMGRTSWLYWILNDMKKEASRKPVWSSQEKVKVFSAENQTYKDVLTSRIMSRMKYENAWKVIFGSQKIVRDIIIKEAQKIDREIARRLERGTTATIAEAYHQIRKEGVLHPSSLEDLQAEERAQVLLLALAVDIEENQWGVVMQKLSIREEDADDMYVAKIKEVLVPLVRTKLAEALARPEDKERHGRKRGKSTQEIEKEQAKKFVDIISAIGPLYRTFGRSVFPDLARRALLNPFIVSEIRQRLREDFEPESQIGSHAKLGCEAIGIPLDRFLRLQKEDAKKVIQELIKSGDKNGFLQKAQIITDHNILSPDDVKAIFREDREDIVKKVIKKDNKDNIDVLRVWFAKISYDLPRNKFYAIAVQAAEEYIRLYSHGGVIFVKDYVPLANLFAEFGIMSRNELDKNLASMGIELKLSGKDSE